MFHFIHVWQSKHRERRKETERSTHWSTVRNHFLVGRKCAACGSGKHLQVHHKMPFHLHPELELDPQNLIALCMDKHECHDRIGHGGNWKFYNPKVEMHCAGVLSEPKTRRRVEGLAKQERLS